MPWAALSQWTFEPVPMLGAALGAFLYWAGRRLERDAARPMAWEVRDTFFAAGLAALLLALVSPIAGFDTQLQWDHMLQHVLLLIVAPPLLILAGSFRSVWRGILALRGSPSDPLPRSLHAIVSWLHRGRIPAITVLLVFSVNLLAWHIPALYDATLVNEPLHDLEHTLFFGLGLLFWDQVIGPLDSSSRLGLMGRSVLVFSGMVVSWALAVVIGYATHPLYAYPGTAGGLGELADQQIAAGIMWVPGGAPFLVALVCFGSTWFDREEGIMAERALETSPK